MPLLAIDIEAKFASFMDAMDKMERRTNRAAKQMSSAFDLVKVSLGAIGVGLSVTGFEQMISGSIKSIDALHRLSLQTGITVETLSALSPIAKQSGTDIDTVSAMVGKLEKNMLAFAQSGGGKAADAFTQLGYSQEQVRTGLQSIDQFLPEFARRLVTTGVGGEQAGLAMQLMAKGGAAALPFLNALAEAGKLVAKVTGDQADEAHRFEVSLAKLEGQSAAFKRTIALEMLPALNDISLAMLDARRGGEGFFGSVVEGAKRAAQAMLGWNNAGDIQKISKQIVEQQDKLLGLEKIQGTRGISKKRVDAAREELVQLQKQFAILEGIKKIEDEGGLTGKPEKPKPAPLPDIPKPPAAVTDTSSTFLSLEKGLKESLLRLNGELSESTKLQLHLDALSEKQLAQITRVRKAALQDLASQIDLKKLDIQIRKSELEVALLEAASSRKNEIEIQAEAEANTARFKSAKDAVELIRFETSLLGLANEQRETAIALRALETSGIDKESEAYLHFGVQLKAAIADKSASEKQLVDMKATADGAAKIWTTAAKEMQHSMSTLFFDMMQGKLTNVSKDFKKALDKMVADSLAAKSAAALFGPEFAKGGDIGGLVGKGIDALGLGNRAPVEERTIKDALTPLAGGADAAANAAAFATSVTTAGTGFASAVTAAGTAAGTAFGTGVDAASALFGPAIDGAGTAFAALVAEAGAIFSAKVATTGASGAGGIASLFAESKGDAFVRGNVIPFARGGVVTTPALFKFAGGTGLMGEAGPEAIMPLRRGADGKLGVVASGGPNVTMNNTFTIEPGTSRETQQQIASGLYQSALRAFRRNR